jgi:hypothetical protein
MDDPMNIRKDHLLILIWFLGLPILVVVIVAVATWLGR